MMMLTRDWRAFMYSLHRDLTTIQQNRAQTIHNLCFPKRATIESKPGFVGLCPFCTLKSVYPLSEDGAFEWYSSSTFIFDTGRVRDAPNDLDTETIQEPHV